MNDTLPLSILADRLTLGPPSLKAILDLLEHSEVLKDFLELVREYLPENEREIMAQDDYGRVEAFISRFSQRYFPLDEGPEDMESLVYQIPVQLAGLTYEDYHEFENWSPGHQLLLSLVVYPYVATFCGQDLAEAQGAKAALLDKVRRIVGDDVAASIPAEGWEPKDLHTMCDGTQFEGVADFADWVCSCTDCWVLDANYESYAPEGWSREVVNGLTEQLPKTRAIWDRSCKMVNWVEDAPRLNFGKLLDFLLERKTYIVPEEQLPLPLETEPSTLMEVFASENEDGEPEGSEQAV